MSDSRMLFEACLQYALNREACTREQIKILRNEADLSHEGRNYYAVSAYFLGRKVIELDEKIQHLKRENDILEQSNQTLSAFITERKK